MRPVGNTAAGQRLGGLLKLEREVFGAWLNWLTSGWGEGQFYSAMDKLEKELAVVCEAAFFALCVIHCNKF
jgi:hypothetical protein